MVICFNCSPAAKTALDELIVAGEFKDRNEVISCAIENFAVLHKHVAENGTMIFDALVGSRPTADGSLRIGKSPGTQHSQVSSGQMKQAAGKTPPPTPEIFTLEDFPDRLAAVAQPPPDRRRAGEAVPLEEWVFGQYNKLLPAKASCRAIARSLKDEPKGVDISEAAWQIADEAWALGDVLGARDVLYGFDRDSTLATAFPRTSDGRRRYASQFVASITKEGRVSGLLVDLKLINRAEGTGSSMLLTEAGWRFAAMQNPVLDNGGERPTRRFSEEEVEFLLDHIARNVPAEDFAYRAILKAISSGADSPEKIDAALGQYVSPEARANLSKPFLSTQRSGAISRMTDLGLLTRVREGVRVTYLITLSVGQEFMKRKN
jgi:hypothetical protein